MKDVPSGQLIPPAPVIRERLAHTARELRLLRSLLKLSEQAERDRRAPVLDPNTLAPLQAAGGVR